MIQQERIKFRGEGEMNESGYAVVYWMQQSQRNEFNHALEYAIFRANQMNLPVVVFFALTPGFPEANYRHYLFMLEGLKEVKEALNKRGVGFVMWLESPEDAVVEFCEKIKPAMLIFDKGYLNVQRMWREKIVRNLKDLKIVEVESDVVIPVETTSNKQEFAARTIRPKITKLLPEFLHVLEQQKVKKSFESAGKEDENFLVNFSSQVDLNDVEKVARDLPIDMKVTAGVVKGGRSEAVKYLKEFIEEIGFHYAENRNQPMKKALSMMSPYLHFGQISALEIALRIKAAVAKNKFPSEQADVYLEELIVRRELSMNFCHFNIGYDRYERALPNWALESLAKRSTDKREFIYTQDEFEKAQTHDEIWNACQNEMVKTGKMHGYMRMYWGKKILEWCAEPAAAFKIALYLNNKYELDGRDPNGFTGVAWCFGKHDRPWGPERPIFGLVRFMNDAGIKRKIKDWKEYVEKWN